MKLSNSDLLLAIEAHAARARYLEQKDLIGHDGAAHFYLLETQDRGIGKAGKQALRRGRKVGYLLRA